MLSLLYLQELLHWQSESIYNLILLIMAEYRIWYSTESFADYIINHTTLSTLPHTKKKMYESDANNAANFHKLPDHIKQILYLDAPDIIVECDMEPIFSIEVSTEAGTGHNAFQRFPRIAAAAENNVPAIYIFAEAVIIQRKKKRGGGVTAKWDALNPLIFKALERVRDIYRIPALLYYFPSLFRSSPTPITPSMIRTKGLVFDADIINYPGCPDSSDSEMKKLFKMLNLIISETQKSGVIKGREKLMGKRAVIDHIDWMNNEFFTKRPAGQMSPITATRIVDTRYLLNHLKRYSKSESELLKSRDETVIYQVNADFRSDPYPGALSALDYLMCREGKTFEERKYNLVLCWGTVREDPVTQNFDLYNSDPRVSKLASINDFIKAVKDCGSKNMLNLDYAKIKKKSIPRYYMQVRYGSMFSKKKEIRVISYFADAILFEDGALWREG